jgi:hypothetical protein
MDSLALALLGSQSPRTRVRISLSSSLVCQRSLSASPTACRGRAAGLRALGLLMALLLGVGCAKQKEGERCDQNNGDLDCDTGLVCVGETQISITGRGVALCCPALTDPTVDACRAGINFPPEPDAGITPSVPAPTPDGGAPPAASTPDAGNLVTGNIDAGLVDSGT